jgi:hypothetical protein
MFQILFAGTVSFVSGFLHGRAESKLDDASQRFRNREYKCRMCMEDKVEALRVNVKKAKIRRVEWLVRYAKMSHEQACECTQERECAT